MTAEAARTPVAMSIDVALLAVRARADLMDDLLARAEDGSVLHAFAHDAQRTYCLAADRLAGGQSAPTVAAWAGLGSLMARDRSAAAFIALADLNFLLSGNTVPDVAPGRGA